MALAVLAARWFKSTGSKSKGEYMSKEDFDPLVEDLVTSLSERLGTRNGAEAIVSKVSRAHQMGSNESLQTFFDEIQLPIGKAEKAAIKARNRPAHGGILAGDDFEMQVRHSHAYRGLFERTLLRILGYEGPYVDRTTLGYPARPLDEPPGGRVQPDSQGC